MSRQRARPAVTAEHRSVHPNVPGVPWWGAVLIAVTATAIGFAFDAGAGKELTSVFGALYAIGCIAAVLAVRQSGIFTAVVQPPVLLFASVPGAYFLFHGAKFTGLKDILINCGYPLIERFPLMLFTAAPVLVIGLIRRYLGRSAVSAADTTAETTAERPATSRHSTMSSTMSKVSGLFSSSESGDDEDGPKRRHAIERPATAPTARTSRTARSTRTTRAGKAAKATKATKKTEPTRSRRRPLLDDIAETSAERPRRRSSTPRRTDLPPEARRRRTSTRDGLRTTRDPYERSETYERRAPHDRRSRYESYDPFEPYEAPQRRRPGSAGSNGSNGSHHPISRVRYRGSTAEESREESRARPRGRAYEADTWEYDI